MNTSSHTTLLDILSQPLTGDAGDIIKEKNKPMVDTIATKKFPKTTTEGDESIKEDIKNISPEDIRE